MTDKELVAAAELYKEIVLIESAKGYLKNCSSFELASGNRICQIPSGLQYRIRELVDAYYKELKEKQKEL